AEEIQNQDAALLAVAIEHRRGKANGGLERTFDLLMLHVEIKRRDKHLTALEPHGLDEIVAASLGLQVGFGDPDSLARVGAVDADSFAPGNIKVTNLVVNALAATEEDELIFQRPASGRLAREVIAQGSDVGQVENIRLD